MTFQGGVEQPDFDPESVRFLLVTADGFVGHPLGADKRLNILADKGKALAIHTDTSLRRIRLIRDLTMYISEVDMWVGSGKKYRKPHGLIEATAIDTARLAALMTGAITAEEEA